MLSLLRTADEVIRSTCWVSGHNVSDVAMVLPSKSLFSARGYGVISGKHWDAPKTYSSVSVLGRLKIANYLRNKGLALSSPLELPLMAIVGLVDRYLAGFFTASMPCWIARVAACTRFWR
jgi:hypothetical protein